MIFQSTVFSLIALFLIMAAGFFLRKRSIIDGTVTKGLSSIIVLIVQPLMSIQGLQAEYTAQRLQTLGIMFGGFAVIVVIGLIPGLVYCLVRRLPYKDCGIWLNISAFSNCIFMVRPIVLSVWGEDSLFPLVGVMLCYNVLIYSIGIFFLSRNGVSIGRQILRSLLNPASIAGLIGLALFFLSVSLPAPIMTAVDMLSNIGTPLAMIVIGSQLAEYPLREVFLDKRVYIASFLRLLAAPALAWVLLRFLIKDHFLYSILMLTALMPVGTTVSVFAERFDNNKQLASRSVFVSTLLSLVTVPLLVMLYL